VVNGRRAGGELPPSLTDPNYALYVTERSVRREDAERASRPEVESADQIKAELLFGSDSKDWRENLTDNSGRPTSFREIAERDPDSMVNVEAREKHRQAMKLANLTGGRIVR
jgi:hypothetical protein